MNNPIIHKPSKEVAQRFLTAIEPGLSKGLGVQKPGEMCIEAALCYAFGLPHSDSPPCVGSDFRRAKISLNDHFGWPSKHARAQGLAKVGVAQIGSDQIDQQLAKETMKLKFFKCLFPFVLKKLKQEKFDKAFSEVKTYADSVKLAKNAANYDYGYGYGYGYDYDYAYGYGYDCSYGYVYGYGYDYDYGYTNGVPLQFFADAILETLIELKSPGCEWLYLCDEAKICQP